MCIGRILGHLLYDIVNEANKALSPLSDVIGPNGILLKPVPATKFIFGRTLTVADMLEIIVEDFCSGNCEFENVFEAIEIFNTIVDDFDKFSSILQMDPDGCGIGLWVQNFTADFQESNVVPVTFGAVPSPDLQFYNQQVKDQSDMINGVWAGVTTQGNFGIQFNIFDDIPMKIIQLILGENIVMVTVTIPELQIAATAQWGVIVWPFPVVEIFVQISAGIIVDIGDIAYYSNGIKDAIETGSHILMGLHVGPFMVLLN